MKKEDFQKLGINRLDPIEIYSKNGEQEIVYFLRFVDRDGEKSVYYSNRLYSNPEEVAHPSIGAKDLKEIDKINKLERVVSTQDELVMI